MSKKENEGNINNIFNSIYPKIIISRFNYYRNILMRHIASFFILSFWNPIFGLYL